MSTFLQVLQIVVIIIGAPALMFRVWRRLDVKLTQHETAVALLRSEFETVLASLATGIRKIDYALWNAGKTGLVNKVDEVLDNQATFMTEMAIVKNEIQHLKERDDK